MSRHYRDESGNYEWWVCWSWCTLNLDVVLVTANSRTVREIVQFSDNINKVWSKIMVGIYYIIYYNIQLLFKWKLMEFQSFYFMTKTKEFSHNSEWIIILMFFTVANIETKHWECINTSTILNDEWCVVWSNCSMLCRCVV